VTPLLSVVAGPPGAGPSSAAGTAPLEVLVGLFILLVAAKVGEEIARRLGQPAVVGELLGGFVVGPYALGLVTPGDVATVFAEIGVVVLLFTVGLEVRLDQLLSVGKPAALTAVIAMILPILAGIGVGILIGEPLGTASFVGLALAATSIGIAIVLMAICSPSWIFDRRGSRIPLGGGASASRCSFCRSATASSWGTRRTAGAPCRSE